MADEVPEEPVPEETNDAEEAVEGGEVVDSAEVLEPDKPDEPDKPTGKPPAEVESVKQLQKSKTSLESEPAETPEEQPKISEIYVEPAFKVSESESEVSLTIQQVLEEENVVDEQFSDFSWDELEIDGDTKGPLSDEDIQELKEAFKLFDKEANGYLTIVELEEMMKNVSMVPNKMQIQQVIESVVEEGKDSIDFGDYLTLISRMMENADTEENIREAFQVFDKENTGLISANILRHALTNVGDRLTDEEVDEMINPRDINDEGFVSLELFVRKICDMSFGDNPKICASDCSEICTSGTTATTPSTSTSGSWM